MSGQHGQREEAASTRVWLDVSYADKDEAKAAGARWDPTARRWYAPHGLTGALAHWAALPDIPDQLPGEDRGYGAGLFVDLVPRSCWFTNVRSCIAPADWDRIRRMVLGRAGHRCEACGAAEARDIQRWLEVHERWAYDDATATQTLKRLICLCTDCHTTTHYGLAQLRGHGGRGFTHLRTVTGMDARAATRHIDDAFATWRRRNQRVWALDLTILTGAGVTLTPPPDAAQRPEAATRGLARARHGDRGRHHEQTAHPAAHTTPGPPTPAASAGHIPTGTDRQRPPWTPDELAELGRSARNRPPGTGHA